MPRSSVKTRREEILQATLAVVAERGFSATRVGDVATHLNISTGLVHYHFASKDRLMAEAFRYAAEQELLEVHAELAGADSSLARLSIMLTQMATPVPAVSWRYWIDGWSEAMRSDEFRKISSELDRAWTADLEAIIVEGVSTGTFTCDDPRGTAWRLAGLCDGLAIQVISHAGEVTPAELREWLLRSADHELGISLAR